MTHKCVTPSPQKTLRLLDKGHPDDAVQGSTGCLSRELCETHKYTVGKIQSVSTEAGGT